MDGQLHSLKLCSGEDWHSWPNSRGAAIPLSISSLHPFSKSIHPWTKLGLRPSPSANPKCWSRCQHTKGAMLQWGRTQGPNHLLRHLLASSDLSLPDPRSTISLLWGIVASPTWPCEARVWRNSALKGQCWLHGCSLSYGLGAVSLSGPGAQQELRFSPLQSGWLCSRTLDVCYVIPFLMPFINSTWHLAPAPIPLVS